MTAARIFAYVRSEQLRGHLETIDGILITDLPPWDQPRGNQDEFDVAFVEVTDETFIIASAWISSLKAIHAGIRIVQLVSPDLDEGQREDLELRKNVTLDVDISLEKLQEQAEQVSRVAEGNREGLQLTIEERLHINAVAMEATNQSFFLIQDGIILDATIPAFDSRGWSSPLLVGRHFLEFLHPSSRDRVARTYMRRMSGEDVPQRYEALAMGPDGGEPFPVELIVKRIQFRGRPAAVGTLSEVAERHAWLSIRDRRERELSLVNEVTHIIISGRSLENSTTRALESILDALDADAGGVFLATGSPRGRFAPLVNRRRSQGRSRPWKKCHEIGPIKLQPDLLAGLRAGHTVDGVPCPETGAMGQHHINAPLLSKNRLTGFIHIVRKHGDAFDEDEATLLGSIAASVAMGVENRRLYEDLQCSYKELLDTQKELLKRERLAVIGNMAAHVAHEIRNPVATIMNASGQLRKRIQFSGIEEELADIIEEELERLRRLCDDLVMFSRTPQPAPQLLQLSEFIGEILAELTRSQFITENIQTAVIVDPPGLQVHQDPDILHQLLRNLLFNALQSMGGKGRLEVNASQDRRNLRVDVKDSGPGIPPEIIDHIFDPFFSTRPESAGLGLAIVRNYVEELGGDLAVTSEEGQGTTIHLTLPSEYPSQPPPHGL